MQHYLNQDLENIQGEIWNDIPLYDGVYSVSNMGRVKSEKRIVRCGKGYWEKPEKILKQTVKKSNPNNMKQLSKTLSVSLSYNNSKKSFNVSELVGRLFIGLKKEKECYSKKNKIWHDCRACNLEIKTISQSIKISYKKGFLNKNKKHLEKYRQPKLIFKRLADNKEFKGGKELKKEYGYDPQSNIKRNVIKNKKCKGSLWQLIPC